MSDAIPHYVTTDTGQIRLWTAGSGKRLVILQGLIDAASEQAKAAADACSGWQIVSVELPGIGGSASTAPHDLGQIAAAVAKSLDTFDDPFVLAARDLSVGLLEPVARVLRRRPEAMIPIGAKRALAWKEQALVPQDLEPRPDGVHFTSLWAFLRDRHQLDPADHLRPVADGPGLPNPSELHACLTAAGNDSAAYQRLWAICLAAVPEEMALGDVTVDTWQELGIALSSIEVPQARPIKVKTKARPDGDLWYEYIQTSRGLVHLRRSGSAGHPLLILPTAGGSATQFAPVIKGFGKSRTTFAMDYIGNGLSGKPEDETTIATLALDALALLDAMGIEQVDVWGSHTGAIVALEMSIYAPERIGRIVMEGPPFLSGDQRDDILANYFPPLEPDKWGLHLRRAWYWRRDTFLYWPWYCDSYAHARKLGLPTTEEMHAYVVGILESGTTYDRAYRAAWGYPTATRLQMLKSPSLICSGPFDMLSNALDDALPHIDKKLVTVTGTPTTVWWPNAPKAESNETMTVYRRFFEEAR